MTRILIAGDTHGNLNHVRYLIGMAAERGIRIVFVVGDFGAWEHTPGGVKFFDDVDEEAETGGSVTVYFLAGNHDNRALVERMYGERVDDEGFLICRPRVRYAGFGHRWTWDRVRFLAFGGAYSVDKELRLEWEQQLYQKLLRKRLMGSHVDPDTAHGHYWFPEEEASIREVERMLNDPTRVDVLLTHDKPDGSVPPGWTYKQPVECYRNQRRIQQIAELVTPTLLVHGHLHFPYEQDVPQSAELMSMRVIGLDCDQPGFHPRYNPLDSWMVLDLDPFDVGEQFPPTERAESRRGWSSLGSPVALDYPLV